MSIQGYSIGNFNGSFWKKNKNKIKHEKELTEMNKVAKLSKGTETFFFHLPYIF